MSKALLTVYTNLFGTQPEDGFMKKAETCRSLIFNYLLIVFT